MLAAPTVAANATTAAKTIPNTNIIFPFLYFKFNIILFLTIFQCYPIFNLYLISNTSLILKSIINLFRILTFQSLSLIINTFRILKLLIFYPSFLIPMQRYNFLCSHTNFLEEKFQKAPISWWRSRTFTEMLQKGAPIRSVSLHMGPFLVLKHLSPYYI